MRLPRHEMLSVIIACCETSNNAQAYEDIIFEKLKHSLRYIEENYADEFQKASYFAELDKAAVCNMVLMSRQNGSFQIG